MVLVFNKINIDLEREVVIIVDNIDKFWIDMIVVFWMLDVRVCVCIFVFVLSKVLYNYI